MNKLNEKEINDKLEEIQGWYYEDEELIIELSFIDFKKAFAFMTIIALEAEVAQHHPTFINVYNELQITLSTHDAGGVTIKDTEFAKIINSHMVTNQ